MLFYTIFDTFCFFAWNLFKDKVWLQNFSLSMTTTILNIFLLDMNFDKSIVGLLLFFLYLPLLQNSQKIKYQ